MTDLLALRDRIRGPVFSVITPFRESDDGIDYDSLARYLRLIHDGGGRIFYVMGYNSRFSELSWDEIRELNEFVIGATKEIDPDSIVIVADPLHCSTAVSLDFALHAQEAGADMISLIFREKFYSNEQVYRHYASIADAINIGILIHEMPFISGHGGHTMHWPVELLDRLADIDNVIAIKEDAKDDDYSHEVISTVRDRVAIVISGGGKRQWLDFAEHGCQAWLNGIGVFEPALATAFWKARQTGDHERCQAIIDDIEVPFFEKVVGPFGWHLGVKGALEARGVMKRYERMPMLALDEREFAIVKSVMDSLPIARYTD
jgi:dihydrodipicolinate synthase/N-acetylneuraminate lyase